MAGLTGGQPGARQEEATLAVRAENERLAVLEEEVRVLRDELEETRQALRDFKAQFE